MTAILNLHQLERAIAAHALMSVTDLDGNIIYANDRFCAVSGYRREELLGHNHRVLKSGVHPAEFYAGIWQALINGQVWQGLICNCRRDGELYWVRSTIMPLNDAYGLPRHYLSLRTEVTQQVALRRGLEELALADTGHPLIDIAAAIARCLRARCVGIARHTPGTTALKVLTEWRRNGAAAATQYDLENSPLADCLVFDGPSVHMVEDLPARYPDVDALLWDGARTFLGAPLHAHDGSAFGVLYVLADHTSADPETAQTLLLVAAVKAAAAILRVDADQRLRTLVNSAPVGVFMADLDGVLTFVSSQMLARYNRNTDDVLNDGWLRLVEPAERQRVTAAWRAFIAGTEVEFVVEFTILADAENAAIVRIRAAPIVEQQQRTGFVGTIEDMSDMRHLERRLRLAQKLEALGVFTAGIAHDFSNILATMLGHAGLARHYLGRDASAKLLNCLANIEAAGHRGRDLITRLLAFSHAPENCAPPVIAVRGVVEETLQLLRPVMPPNLRFELSFAQMLPDVAIDPTELQQALMNLAINARDASGPDDPIFVDVMVRRCTGRLCSACAVVFSGEFVEVTVRDQGSGIAPALLEKIFQPFFTTKREHGGSGLGLAVVHGVVHRNRGHIEIISAPGTGTCVAMLLPVVSADDVPVASVIGTPPDTAS